MGFLVIRYFICLEMSFWIFGFVNLRKCPCNVNGLTITLVMKGCVERMETLPFRLLAPYA